MHNNVIFFTVCISDKKLRELSRLLRKESIIDIAVDYLKLGDSDVKNIDQENNNDARGFIYEVLKLWKSKHQNDSTAEALKEIFQRACTKVVISDEAMKLLTNEINQHKEVAEET